MSKTVKLTEYSENIQRGAILRCIGKYPYEDFVDFMLIEYPCGENRQYALLVNSGYKAGLIFVVLPEEANANTGINIDWLKENWQKWGYTECSLEETYLVFRENLLSVYD